MPAPTCWHETAFAIEAPREVAEQDLWEIFRFALRYW